MLNKSLFVGLALSLMPLTVGAQALVDATDVDVLAALVQSEGYKAQVGTDGVGDPMISSSANGYDFDVFFYGCTDGANCRDLTFSVTFDVADGMSLTKVQDFNREKRWIKIYLDDESDPIVEMDYNIYGGVSPENFTDTLDWWVLMMNEFIEYIDF